MPPPPPPPMKYVSKTTKSPPRQPVSPIPSGGGADRLSSPPLSTRPRSSTVATPEKPNGGNNKSPMGRSRAMSRPAGRPPPQFSNNNNTGDHSGDQTTRTPSSSSPPPPFQSDIRPTTATPPQQSSSTSPLPTTHQEPPQHQQRVAVPASPLHHQQSLQQPSSSPSSSTSQHLENENKELRLEVHKLKATVETLQRDNNLLQDRLGSLLDCGITPATSNLESYYQSRRKDSLLHQPPSSSISALAAAVGVGNAFADGGGDGASSLEHEFMKVRIQRLEAALALEMKARESLEDTCAAQKKVIVHRLAAMQQQQQQHQ